MRDSGCTNNGMSEVDSQGMMEVEGKRGSKVPNTKKDLGTVIGEGEEGGVVLGF